MVIGRTSEVNNLSQRTLGPTLYCSPSLPSCSLTVCLCVSWAGGGEWRQLRGEWWQGGCGHGHTQHYRLHTISIRRLSRHTCSNRAYHTTDHRLHHIFSVHGWANAGYLPSSRQSLLTRGLWVAPVCISSLSCQMCISSLSCQIVFLM